MERSSSRQVDALMDRGGHVGNTRVSKFIVAAVVRSSLPFPFSTSLSFEN